MPPPPKPKRAADNKSLPRFDAALIALVGKAAAQSDRFGVAVSGGGDSMALLHMAHRLLGDRMAAASVDHGLRPGSAEEAAMVADWCAQRGIAHDILHPARPIRGSLQSAAREARYDALHRWRIAAGIDWLMTAHHADDQLETLLMRLNRGSGVGGLAAIRRRNDRVIRPLLSWRHAELLDYCAAAGLPIAEDPSNTDPRFDRARMRQTLRHSALADMMDIDALGRSTDALAEADQALDWAATHLIAGWSDSANPMILRDEAYPPELRRRIVAHRLGALDPPPELRGAALTRLLEMMETRKPAMIGEWRILPDRRDAALWHILRAPERKARSIG